LGISVWKERVPFATSSIRDSRGTPGRLKDRESYRTGDKNIKDDKSVTHFPLGSFHRENGTTFSEIPFIPENFQWNEPKPRVPFTSQPEFPEFFGKWKTSQVTPCHLLRLHELMAVSAYGKFDC